MAVLFIGIVLEVIKDAGGVFSGRELYSTGKTFASNLRIIVIIVIVIFIWFREYAMLTIYMLM